MKKNNIDRRDFFKTAGSAALVMGGLGAVAGCKNGGDSSAALGMTGEFGFALRTFPQILTFCENFVQIFLYGAYFYVVNENCFSR